MSKKIAIIGSGIAGLTCGYLLNKKHNICMFEANDYIGGHTATKDVTVDGESFSIDTGFIVFNDWTYPNFIKLLTQLNVPTQATEMSFSVKNLVQNIEYNGNTVNSLFAQRRNLFRPRFYRIIRDIVRFNKLCKSKVIKQGGHGTQTLYEFLQQHKFSSDFNDNYILPMCSAIWSTSLQDIKAFPFSFFLQFFNNHGLLNITKRPQWRTIIGGSSQYIKPLTVGFMDKIRLNSPVTSVKRQEDKYLLEIHGKGQELFDEVIFACHSDQALRLLAEPSALHKDILGDIAYQDNEVVLHTDTSVLPKRGLAWASWNYLIKGGENEEQAPIVLTYNMNILQRLTSKTIFCVTLNNSADIDASKILGRYHYAHPQFNLKSLAAQRRRVEISGQDGLHFCGAYWYNGFHEDGVRSALDVCAHYGETL